MHTHEAPKWLQEGIKARAEQFGPLIFGEHKTKDIDVITDVWRFGGGS
jgi:hypothetical protein